MGTEYRYPKMGNYLETTLILILSANAAVWGRTRFGVKTSED